MNTKESTKIETIKKIFSEILEIEPQEITFTRLLKAEGIKLCL